MQITKLTQKEFEEAQKNYMGHTAIGIPLEGVLPIDEDIKHTIDSYLNNPNPTAAFAFFFRGYGEPTIGYHEGVLFEYAFQVCENIIIVKGTAISLEFKVLIPTDAMTPKWKQDIIEAETFSKECLDNGIPLLTTLNDIDRLSLLSDNLLSEEDARINTENTLVFAKKVLNNSDFDAFVRVYQNPSRFVSEGEYCAYLDSRQKIVDAVSDLIRKSGKDKRKRADERCFQPYEDAKNRLLRFCCELAKIRLRFDGKYSLSIRGFEHH